MKRVPGILTCTLLFLIGASYSSAQSGFNGLKADAIAGVEERTKMAQEIVDSLFRFQN